jgi:hypothetical protein
MSDMLSRRQALLRLAASAGAAGLGLVLPRPLRAHAPAHRAKHPDPRPGITGEAVLPDDAVPERSRAAYRVARKIPGILDGLYCHCDCAERDGLRSLLSCFEAKMATTCGVCRGEAVLAGRLHEQGKTLDEIRAAVDDEYGR